MIPKHIQEKLNAIAQARASELYERAREVLSQDQYVTTGELLNSLKISWFPASDQSPPRILLQYKLQGFLLGLSKMSWVKVPNIEKMNRWSENVTFDGAVPGYKNGAPNLPPWKAKQRIVFAIAMNKRKNDTWKRKPWKGKGGLEIGDLLKQINQETLQAWAKEVETAIAEGLSKGTILS